MPWPARHRTALTVAIPGLLVALAFLLPAQFRLFWPGLCVSILGQAIRLWSAGCLHKDERVIDTGPFACTRNPLYVGSFVVGIGHCLMSGLYWSFLLLPLFWAIYYPTVRHEERFLQTKFGPAFEAYCARVPRIVPRWPGLAALRVGFACSQVAGNREYEALAANALAAGLFALAGAGG